MSAGTSVPEQAARLVERAQKVALCLDFDGTLSPIVEDPQAARPLPGIVELLGPLAERFAAVAVVSGRPAAYLAEHAAARGVRYLGLYGLQEIREGQLRVDPRLKARAANGNGTSAVSDRPRVRYHPIRCFVDYSEVPPSIKTGTTLTPVHGFLDGLCQREHRPFALPGSFLAGTWG